MVWVVDGDKEDEDDDNDSSAVAEDVDASEEAVSFSSSFPCSDGAGGSGAWRNRTLGRALNCWMIHKKGSSMPSLVCMDRSKYA